MKDIRVEVNTPLFLNEIYDGNGQLRPHYIKVEGNFLALRNILIEIDVFKTKIDQLEAEQAFPGLLDAVLKGKVGSNNVPGRSFVGDKEFYRYVDSLIGFYLHEVPLLKSMGWAKSYARRAASS